MAAAKSTSSRSRAPHRRNPDPTAWVDLGPFRDAFARRVRRDGLTIGDVARTMNVDRERVAVLLGVKGSPRKKRKTLSTGELRTYTCKPQQRVSYDVGVALCRALEAAPVDVGV